MATKAKQGIWPSFAPPGYGNVVGPDGKRTIEPDPVDGPVVTRLFERFAKGDASIKILAREFPTIRGRRLFSAQIHQALRKRIYTGDFDFDGVRYSGNHTPLVSRETWERVQAILDGRTSSKSRQSKHQFTLTGLSGADRHDVHGPPGRPDHGGFLRREVAAMAHGAEADPGAHDAVADDGAAIGHGGGPDHPGCERRLRSIRAHAAAAAAVDRVVPDGAGDLAGRKVRVDAEIGASGFGALELCRPNK